MNVTFAIHDLNARGGHDRSTLEVARRISHFRPVELVTFSFEDPAGVNQWGNYQLRKMPFGGKAPALLRLTWFYFITLFPLLSSRLLSRTLVHSTGACVLISNVVQVQFVTKSWKKVRNSLGDESFSAPRARGAGPFRRALFTLYNNLILSYNVLVENIVYRPHKTYIAISETVKRELMKEFSIPEENIHVIRHGVSSDQFRPIGLAELSQKENFREKWGIGSDDFLLLFVGAYERKGLPIALKALSRLEPEQKSRIRLMAVGSGNQEGFEALAKNLGVQENLILHPPTKEVEKIYRYGDAFILPTLYEPFGLVILEAMAAGLPCLVSRLAGASELLEDGKSGLFIENPEDPGEIAAKILKLSENPTFCEELSRNARHTAESRPWDRVAEEYESVFQDFCGKSK